MERVTTVVTRRTTTMTTKRQSIAETRERLRTETELAAQVEGVGHMVATCVDALEVRLYLIVAAE